MLALVLYRGITITVYIVMVIGSPKLGYPMSNLHIHIAGLSVCIVAWKNERIVVLRCSYTCLDLRRDYSIVTKKYSR